MTSEEQEALSYSYAVKQNILRLSSGRYAIFGHYNYSEGRLPLLHIGDWASCEPFVTEYVPPARRETPRPLPLALAGLNLDLDL
jgi:hypothetical protein